MALPVAVNKRTVVWTLLDNGTPVPGIELKFAPTTRVTSASGVTTTIADETATTDGAGHVSVSLACTDDTDTSPQLGKWTVSGVWPDGTAAAGTKIGGNFDVPVASSAPLNLASVVFTATKTGTGPNGLVTLAGALQIVQAELAGFEGGAAQLNERGAYTSGMVLAVADVVTWQGGRYATATGYTGGSSPDLSKMIALGTDIASRVGAAVDDDGKIVLTLPDGGQWRSPTAWDDLGSGGPGGGDEPEVTDYDFVAMTDGPLAAALTAAGHAADAWAPDFAPDDPRTAVVGATGLACGSPYFQSQGATADLPFVFGTVRVVPDDAALPATSMELRTADGTQVMRIEEGRLYKGTSETHIPLAGGDGTYVWDVVIHPAGTGGHSNTWYELYQGNQLVAEPGVGAVSPFEIAGNPVIAKLHVTAQSSGAAIRRVVLTSDPDA